jgi:hypothetical protein
MVGPVEFNYKKRESYVNVVDLRLKAENIVEALRVDDPKLCERSTYERKIVLQRVKKLSVNGATFTTDWR